MDVHLQLAVGDIKRGNLVDCMQRVVDSARAKGAPDGAAVRLTVSPLGDPGAMHVQPQPIPHEVAIWWHEPMDG